MIFITERLGKTHARESFSCGEPSLDKYLHHQAGQDMRRRLSVCFVALEGKEVIGYYTLSSASVAAIDCPHELRSKLSRSYGELPVTLLGRFAVAEQRQGTGFGGELLYDALMRCEQLSSTEIGSTAVVTDPLNEWALKFYKKYGFLEMPETRRVILGMDVISKLKGHLSK